MRTAKAFLVFFLSVAALADSQFGTGLKFRDPATDPRARQVDAGKWLAEKGIKAKVPPASFDLLDYVPPVDSQGGQGSCVAWATGYYMMAIQRNLELNRTDPVLKAHDRNRFSPAFMYNMMHVPFDHGAYYSDAFEMLHELGVCSWATMPYNDGDYLTWPDESAFIEAMRSRTTEDRNTYNWMRLNGTADLVAAKELIVSGYAPIISIMVYDPYREIDSVNDEYTITEGRVGTDPGGHA